MRRAAVSIMVVVTLLAGGFLAYELADDESGTYTITATVSQAPNLFEGGRVMVRGVQVGSITSVAPQLDGVSVTMEINSDVRIPSSAKLSVIPITVISDRYVQLWPAYKGGASLVAGDHIDLARTSVPAELDDVLKQLKGLLAALEPKKPGAKGALARLITSLDKVFEGRSDELAGTLDKSALVLENLADSSADITSLIQNLDTLFVSFANRSSEIGLVNQRFQLVAQALAGSQKDLEKTTENVAFLSSQAGGLIKESGKEFARSFQQLAGVLDDLLENQDQLIAGVKWTNVIAQSLGAVDEDGRGQNAYTGYQAQPGTPGAEYNFRIDTRDTVACERIGTLVTSFRVLNPAISIENIRESILNFIPEQYHDDLSYLLDALIPLCSRLPGEEPALDEDATAVIEQIAAEIGEERFKELLAQWLIYGVTSQEAAP